MRFLHVGIPTREVKSEEVYCENLKIYSTNPKEHQYSIKYFRCDESSPLPEILQTQPYLAYEVDNMDDAIKGVEELLVDPFELNGTVIAYVIKDTLLIQFQQLC